MIDQTVKIGLNLSNMDTVVPDARSAERRGFDYFGTGKLLFFHGPTSNSFVQLAAAVTSRIRLVSAIALLPRYLAPIVAKLAASLDRVSGGRFDLCPGSGGEFPAEFAAAGVELESRFRRVDEGLRVIEQLFTGDTVTFDGEFHPTRRRCLTTASSADRWASDLARRTQGRRDPTCGCSTW